MAGLLLWTANRLERLARALAVRLQDRADDPFVPETIIVQSRGMERWLALEIARHNGIAANLDFPFPDAFLEDILEALLPGSANQPDLRRETMTLGIFSRLAEMVAQRPEFAALGAYLREDANGVRRLQLAEQIADLFDQYLVFRPDMVLDWDAGRIAREGDHVGWQALLWRELTRHCPGGHRAQRWQRMLERVAADPSSPACLPRRVSVFGISYLPPFYLQALATLSQAINVELYQLNPCREYWADIVSREESKRLQRPWRDFPDAPAEADLHLEEGNRLLAVMGGQGRAFHRLIGQYDPSTVEDFQRASVDSLLAAVQNDVLALRNPKPHNAVRSLPRDSDPSLQIHACHSPMREIEVLYDQLLERLNTDPDLSPWDILVLMPDIDTYAPYIQAVFGAPEEETLRLPFSIADRSPLQSRPLVEAFFLLMDLKRSRFQASEVLSLLDLQAVRSAFGLTEEDGRLIGEWISEARIRWGLDAEAKALLGLPPTRENTWRAGLDRLLLGYALPAEKEHLFEGILPARGVEGTNVEALGHLARFLDELSHWQARFSQRRPFQDWAGCLLQLIGTIFSPSPEEESDLQLLRRLITGMRHYSQILGQKEAVGIEVVRAYLKRRLEGERSGGGFISGGITFAALLPMRSIPSKMICLLGMNQDSFPREDRPPGFDLMAADPRLGDRSRRHDDHYLFLEALISARRYFYISYVGFDIQDNSLRPPSVLVSELIDYIADGYGRSEQAIVVRHRLQPFSQAYFTTADQRLFSYSRQYREAAESLASSRAHDAAPDPFLAGPLTEGERPLQAVDIDALEKALGHPCRFLLENRLQINLREFEAEDLDRESFALAPLERYMLGQDLIESLLARHTPDEAQAKAVAAGRLPHGAAGRMCFDSVLSETEDIAAAVLALQGGAPAQPLAIAVAIPPYTITGRLGPLFPAGQVLYRYGKARGPDLIGAWLRHLIWCRLAEDALACATTLVTRDGQYRIRGFDPPASLLEDLLALYHRAGHEVVPLFPRSSWDYAVLRFAKGFDRPKALEHVRGRWNRSFGWPGESADPYLKLCFRGIDPLDEVFAATAEAVFGPILQHAEMEAS